MLDTARTIMTHAREKGVKFYLPVDCVVANKVSPDAEIRIVPVQEIPPGWAGLDIGPASMRLFAEALQNVRTIMWNGPMGLFEMEPFSRGTFFLAHTVADSYALTIIGGGDTDVAVQPRRASPRTCPTSPPAAAPPSSCSRASRCRASKC